MFDRLRRKKPGGNKASHGKGKGAARAGGQRKPAHTMALRGREDSGEACDHDLRLSQLAEKVFKHIEAWSIEDAILTRGKMVARMIFDT
jgi:hypothetical protein